MVPPTVSVVSAITGTADGTAEGDTVTFQCEYIVLTCNNSGEWNPDPACRVKLVCNRMPTTSESTCRR